MANLHTTPRRSPPTDLADCPDPTPRPKYSTSPGDGLSAWNPGVRSCFGFHPEWLSAVPVALASHEFVGLHSGQMASSTADSACRGVPVWIVTTIGDLPDDCEQREHEAAVLAWNDYEGRILELEIDGFLKDSEAATKYGLQWMCQLYRGQEPITVSIARTG